MMFTVHSSGFRVQGSGFRVKNPLFHFLFSIFYFRFLNPKSKIQNPKLEAGFTILELIIIIVIVGILAASIGYRFYSTADISSPVGVDQVVADIQYVQMRAMGTGISQSISFNIGSSIYNIPGEQKTLPGGATVTNTTLPGNTLTFNSLGEPTFSGTGDKSITISGGATITIYAVTGRVSG